jgi:hypothetical protein
MKMIVSNCCFVFMNHEAQMSNICPQCKECCESINEDSDENWTYRTEEEITIEQMQKFFKDNKNNKPTN